MKYSNYHILTFFIFFFISQNIFPIEKNKTISSRKVAYKKGKKFFEQYQQDSAYLYFYKTLLLSRNEKDSLYIVKSLYKLATIDFYHKDYKSCEKNITDAIEFISNKKKIKYSLLCYNLMGLSLQEQKHYKDAIKYFNKYRQTYLKKSDTVFNFITFHNNMGLLYQASEAYEQSVFYFDRILKQAKLKSSYPVKYARTMDNKAWSLYKNSQPDLALPLFIASKNIRELKGDQPGLVMSYFHLGHYYNQKQKKKLAKDYILQSIKIAEKIDNIEGELKALFLLSQIDTPYSNVYFSKYKILKDSLLQREREFKDQSSRIRFETAEKDAEINLQKLEVKNKNQIIFWAFIGVFVLSISSLIFFFQKKKIFKQKEAIKTLQKEVHHTAKNNLYKTLSYISHTKDKATAQSFLALENRVSSMLKLHEILYRTDHSAGEALQDYLQEICNMLHKSYTDSNKEIKYQVWVDGAIPYKEVELIGRITNELVTNIYKHAFVNKEKGFYRVEVKRNKKEVILSLRDNGVGFPKDFDLKNLKSYGMQMINGLIVQQLGGEFSIKKLEDENKVLIKFKIQE